MENQRDLLCESFGDSVTASSIESDLEEFPISDSPGAACLIDIELNFSPLFSLSSPTCLEDGQRMKGRERGRPPRMKFYALYLWSISLQIPSRSPSARDVCPFRVMNFIPLAALL